MCLASITPIDLKFGQQPLGKPQIDIGELEDIPNIGTGLPLRWQEPGFAVDIHGCGKPGPLATDMTDESRIPGACDFALLAPVQHKFGDRIFNKFRVDAAALQDLQCIFAGEPASAHRFGSIGLIRAGRLAFAPASDDLRSELAVPRIGGFPSICPVHDEFGKLLITEFARNAMQRQLSEQFRVGLPAWRDLRLPAGGSGRIGR